MLLGNLATKALQGGCYPWERQRSARVRQGCKAPAAVSADPKLSRHAQAVEAPTLSIMVPLLLRGLRERATAIKRKSCLIIDNMAKLVDNPNDAAVFLPRLLPGVEKVRPPLRTCPGLCSGFLGPGGQASVARLSSGRRRRPACGRPCWIWQPQSGLACHAGSQQRAVRRWGGADGGSARVRRSRTRCRTRSAAAWPPRRTRRCCAWSRTWMPSRPRLPMLATR